MPSIRETSLGTHRRRRSSVGRLLPVAVALIAAGSVGCADISARAAKPAQSKEPYLVLKLSERRVYVMEDGSAAPVSYQVAIGRPQFPTPTGHFQINEMVENPDFLAFDFNNPGGKDRGRVAPGINNPLGLRWIGFAFAHGWQVGFHGTAKTEVLGQAVSHGCVRMSNPDVVAMFSKVRVGTPVIVEP